MKIQDFHDALKDNEVKLLFADIINSKIDAKLIQLKTNIASEFSKKIDKQSVNLAALRAGIQRKDAIIGSLNNENDLLKSSIRHLNDILNEAEAYQRRENLIFNGLLLRMADIASVNDDPLAESCPSIASQIATFCSDKLNIDIADKDISVAHALGNGRKAIIVRFVRRYARDKVFYAKTKLKNYKDAAGNKVFINEDLTENARKILKVARTKLRDRHIAAVWIKSGHVFYKDNRGTTTLHSLDEAFAL